MKQATFRILQYIVKEKSQRQRYVVNFEVSMCKLNTCMNSFHYSKSMCTSLLDHLKTLMLQTN